jgi:hypothetical protein
MKNFIIAAMLGLTGFIIAPAPAQAATPICAANAICFADLVGGTSTEGIKHVPEPHSPEHGERDRQRDRRSMEGLHRLRLYRERRDHLRQHPGPDDRRVQQQH